MKIMVTEKNRALCEEMDRKLMDTTLQEMQEKAGGSLKFPVYPGNSLMETDISELDLSQRSFNCLKRAGYSTVGMLVSGIDGEDDLLKIRNLGRKSADEIMMQLMVFQYGRLGEERRMRFLDRMKELNSR